MEALTVPGVLHNPSTQVVCQARVPQPPPVPFILLSASLPHSLPRYCKLSTAVHAHAIGNRLVGKELQEGASVYGLRLLADVFDVSWVHVGV